MSDFKPNIYPIMYWGLMYGLIAGFLLFILYLMSRYITVLWFPVFLAGMIWGGYRNYKKQKTETGTESAKPNTPVEEFKEAAKDIFGATRDMVAEQAQEMAQQSAAEDEAKSTEETSVTEEPLVENEEPIAPSVPSAGPIMPPTKPAVFNETEAPRKNLEQPKEPDNK